MNLSNMELRHLRNFIVIAEEEHFGRASRRLAVVQPALSRLIHEIEDELGVLLFDRIGRRVRLTNAGQSFLKDAHRVLQEVDRAVLQAKLAARGQVGTLTVSFVEGMTDSLLVPRLLAEFRRRVPDAHMELQLLPSHLQWNALRNDEINIGFLYFLPTDIPTLRSLPIARIRILIALPKGHRLERKKRIMLRDLCGEPFVWFPRSVNPPYFDFIMQACHAGGLTMNVVNEAPSESMLLGLTASGVGVCFAMDRGRPYNNVVLRPICDFEGEIIAHAMWRDDDSSPILPQFVSQLNEVVPTANKDFL